MKNRQQDTGRRTIRTGMTSKFIRNTIQQKCRNCRPISLLNHVSKLTDKPIRNLTVAETPIECNKNVNYVGIHIDRKILHHQALNNKENQENNTRSYKS